MSTIKNRQKINFSQTVTAFQRVIGKITQKYMLKFKLFLIFCENFIQIGS